MKRTGIKRTSSLSRSGGLGGSAPKKKRGAISPASQPQRDKARGSFCRVCKSEAHSPEAWLKIDPAHVIDRSIGGCNEADCIVPLCRRCHDAYDAHTLDLLPYLTLEEQAHAVGHLGLTRALRRITGERHIPESEAA